MIFISKIAKIRSQYKLRKMGTIGKDLIFVFIYKQYIFSKNFKITNFNFEHNISWVKSKCSRRKVYLKT